MSTVNLFGVLAANDEPVEECRGVEELIESIHPGKATLFTASLLC